LMLRLSDFLEHCFVSFFSILDSPMAGQHLVSQFVSERTNTLDSIAPSATGSH
jgi:hypothetical protein